MMTVHLEYNRNYKVILAIWYKIAAVPFNEWLSMADTGEARK